MKVEAKKLIKGELIGLYVEIIDSDNLSDVGIKGKIVDETKKTLSIDGKMVFKEKITLKIGNVKIDGIKLVGRPHERIKLR